MHVRPDAVFADVAFPICCSMQRVGFLACVCTRRVPYAVLAGASFLEL